MLVDRPTFGNSVGKVPELGTHLASKLDRFWSSIAISIPFLKFPVRLWNEIQKMDGNDILYPIAK